MSAAPARPIAPTALAPRRLAAPADPVDTAYKDGFAAGAGAAREEAAADIDALRAALREIEAAVAAAAASRRDDLCAALRAILAAITPALATRLLEDEIAARLDGGALDAVAVSANADTTALLRRRLSGADAIEFEIDEARRFGDVSARWRGGGVDARIGAAIEALQSFLASPNP